MTPEIVNILVLAVTIAASPFLASALRLPVVVVEILAGSLLAWIGFLTAHPSFALIAKVGFLYLMFLAGLEVNIKEFIRLQGSLLKRAILYFVILYSSSALIVWYAELSVVYLVALPIVSLGMIMALVKEYGKEEPWIRLVLTIGILGELISIMAMTILSGGLQYGLGIEFFQTLAILLGIGILLVLVYRSIKALFWWFPGIKSIIMPEVNPKDQDVRFSMGIFFILIGVMLSLHIDVVLGAFVAGVFISTFFGHKSDLAPKLSSFGFGFLVPIFFIYVGSTLNVKAIVDLDILTSALAMIVVMIGIRMMAAMSYIDYLGGRDTVFLALGDSMPLTFLVAIATLGFNAGALSQHQYFSFIVAAMMAGVGIMTLIKILRTYWKQVN